MRIKSTATYVFSIAKQKRTNKIKGKQNWKSENKKMAYQQFKLLKYRGSTL